MAGNVDSCYGNLLCRHPPPPTPHRAPSTGQLLWEQTVKATPLWGAQEGAAWVRGQHYSAAGRLHSRTRFCVMLQSSTAMRERKKKKKTWKKP